MVSWTIITSDRCWPLHSNSLSRTTWGTTWLQWLVNMYVVLWDRFKGLPWLLLRPVLALAWDQKASLVLLRLLLWCVGFAEATGKTSILCHTVLFRFSQLIDILLWIIVIELHWKYWLLLLMNLFYSELRHVIRVHVRQWFKYVLLWLKGEVTRFPSIFFRL